jgi:hypothetical protein
MGQFGHAYFKTYDASAPSLRLRASGSDPLDAVITWITPRRGIVPPSVRVGWTQTQVRAIYGDRLESPTGLTCPLTNQLILAVYDGAPVAGTPRLWFVFDNGELASASTSSVDLAGIGWLDC